MIDVAKRRAGLRVVPQGEGSLGPTLVLLVAVCLGGCAAEPRPETAARVAAGTGPEVAVVLVPGLTGSTLRNRATGETVWGEGLDLVLPRDGGYNMALPVGDRKPRLEAVGVLEDIRLGPADKGIYGPLIEALEARGYRRGRLEAPFEVDRTLYTFAYDWRRSAVRAAGELASALDGLRRARGDAVLRVDLICQSSGGYVCRWLAKYGGATLERPEAAPAGPRADVRVRKLVLVGSANGGSLRILREMDRGRRYLAPVGRRMRPEVLFTFPALFEDLPHAAEGLLLDGDGEPVAGGDTDLYDPATWRRYGWSAFGPEAARRIAESGRTDLFGTEAERVAFLDRSLRRARRFQALLTEDPEFFGEGIEYYLVGNAYAQTPRRAVVMEGRRGWRTLFTGDRELERRPYVAARSAAPGDGHATVASMHHLSPAEQRALAAEPLYVHGGHFEMILRPAVHRRILEFLLE